MTHQNSESETGSDSETSLDKFTTAALLIGSFLNFGRNNLVDFEENQSNIQKKLDHYRSQCQKLGLKKIETVIKVLSAIEESQYLNLDGLGIGSLQLQTMFETFAIYPPSVLIKISLRNNHIEPYCCQTIQTYLQINKTLKILNLEGCKIGDEGAKSLSVGMSITASIENLKLANCQISDKGAALLVESFKWNTSCKQLDLSSNFMAFESAKAIEDVLVVNKSLRSFNMSHNLLYEDYAIVQVLKGLTRNETLEHLDLSWNSLCGEPFGKLLIKAIKLSKLKILKMEQNRMSTFELRKLSIGLKRSKTIEEVYVADNLMLNEEDIVLISIFKSKSPLKLLSFGKWFHLSREAFSLLQEVKKKKPLIQVIFKNVILPNPPKSINMLDIYADRAKFLALKPKNKRQKRDIGIFMLQLKIFGEPYILREDFLKRLQNFKAKLDEDLIRQYMDAFTDDLKRVNIKSMADHYLNRHPSMRIAVKK